MSLNREIAPPINALTDVEIQVPDPVFSDKKIPIFVFSGGIQPVIRIEIAFCAGKLHETFPLQFSFTNELLAEGTKNYTSSEISKKFDFYGVNYFNHLHFDYASLGMTSIEKNFSDVLPLLDEICNKPIFPEEEFKNFELKSRQKFTENIQKNKYLAARKFNELLFGANHPYGKIHTIDDYKKIGREKIVDFYKQNYHEENCCVLISGAVTDQTIAELQKGLSFRKAIDCSKKPPAAIESKNAPYFTSVETANQMQNTIRMGKLVMPMDDPDYPGILVLNTILGGYFGSRLMKAIRETSGLTYGIRSQIKPLKQANYFFIETEVAAEHTLEAIQQIKEVILKLRKELVNSDELLIVKNYILGNLLRSTAHPLILSQLLRDAIVNNQPKDFYQKFVQEVLHINAEKIFNLANTYLDPETFITVTAGKPIK